jgi:hypothetical protein
LGRIRIVTPGHETTRADRIARLQGERSARVYLGKPTTPAAPPPPPPSPANGGKAAMPFEGGLILLLEIIPVRFASDSGQDNTQLISLGS